MRALILGAGAVGARVARQLLVADTVDRVVLRDTSADRLAWASRTLGDRADIQHHPFPSSIEADVVVVASGMTVVVLEEAGGIVVVLEVTEAGAPRLGSVVVVDPRLRIAGRSSPPPQDARRAQMVTTRQMPVRRIASF